MIIFILPSEVAERILVLCHPRDVAAFSQTCHRAHDIVYRPSDLYLWRTLFLAYPFDDPRPTTSSEEPGQSSSSPSPNSEVDWRTKLQRRVRAERIARRDGDRHECLQVVLECIRETAAATREPSHNLSWVKKVLTLEESPWIESFLRLEHLNNATITSALASDVDQLRAHLALSLDHGMGSAEVHEKFGVLRRLGRAHIYDLRNYSREAHWGPFTHAGGRVNWTHVNAIVTVVAMNLRDFGVHWPKEFKPHAIVQGLEACRPYSAPGTLNRSPLDWAGVEGQWMRIVCFCDYRCVSMSHSFPITVNRWSHATKRLDQ